MKGMGRNGGCQVDFDFRDDAVREKDIPMSSYVHGVDFLGKILLRMLILLINTREV